MDAITNINKGFKISNIWFMFDLIIILQMAHHVGGQRAVITTKEGEQEIKSSATIKARSILQCYHGTLTSIGLMSHMYIHF